MKGFSVLTVSKRRGWEIRAADQLRKQTALADEWVVVHEHPTELDDDFTEPLLLFAPSPLRSSNLNASLNEGLRHIDTDYVIFYQDFIDLPDDCFEKLLNLADENTFVTTCTPNYDGSDDGRYLGVDLARPCRPEEWEANVAIAPMKIIRELGGFDEEYDNGWSWDNVNLAERAAMLGCGFVLDESNRPQLLPHEQTSKLVLEPNGEFHTKRMQEIREGKRPLKVNYL